MAADDKIQPHYPYPEQDIEKAREGLKGIISTFFDDFLEYLEIKALAEKSDKQAKSPLLKLRIGVNVPPFRRQIKAPAGIGKTTFVAQALSRCKGTDVWFMVPTLELAAEVAETIRRNSTSSVYVIKGRTKEMCARHEIASMLGTKGLNVQESLCQKGEDICPYFDTCPYQSQLQELRDLKSLTPEDPVRIFVMPHAYAIVNSALPTPDLVIIDESIWQNFLDITGHGRPHPDLSFFDLKEAEDKLLPESAAYAETIEKIIGAMQVNPAAYLVPLRKSGLPDFEKAITHIKAVIGESGNPRIRPSYTERRIKADLAQWRGPLLRNIKYMLERIREEARNEKSLPVSVICNLSLPQPIRLHGLKQPVIDKGTPILLIDASADAEINKRIWGHYLQTAEITVERNAVIYQVKRRTFSKSSLGIQYNVSSDWIPQEEHLRLRQEVARFVNEIAEQTLGLVFFAASKKIVEALQPLFTANNITAGHFGNLRGKNEFQSAETIIVLGREEPGIDAIESMSRALLSQGQESILTTGGYSSFSRNRRMKDGHTEKEFMRGHPDPFAQRILEQIREREIEQALDRGRLINSGSPKTVFLLTSIVLDVTVDHSLPWEALIRVTRMDQAAQRAMTQTRAFPLGDAELSRIFPDLWSTRDAVKSYIARRGGLKWVETLIRYYMGIDPLLMVEYRHPSQKRWSKAIVSGAEPDARAALEKLIGPVAAFRISHEINYIDEESDDAAPNDDAGHT